MKKMMSVLALLLLLTSCAPEPEIEPAEGGSVISHRVWESWAEMKEVLGDHYLYPTYLPEVADHSERPILRSWFIGGDREGDADELFFGYSASFRSEEGDNSILIRVIDIERRRGPWAHLGILYDMFKDSPRFNEHIVTKNGVDITFASYFAIPPPPDWWYSTSDEWYKYHARNGRAILYSFKIGTVTYEMSWVQFNVEDKYADDEQREGMLRVARSIIEQVKGGE